MNGPVFLRRHDAGYAQHADAASARIADAAHDRRCTERADTIAAKLEHSVAGPLRHLEKSGANMTRQQKVHWLRVVNSAWEAALEGSTPCRIGCSSCCHIAAQVEHSEAIAIAEHLGMPAPEIPAGANTMELKDGDLQVSLASSEDQVQKRYLGVACPFLVEARCSIYDHRPRTCRQYHTVSDDALLCRLYEDADTGVPSTDTRMLHVRLEVALRKRIVYADIREWFAPQPVLQAQPQNAAPAPMQTASQAACEQL